MRVAGLALAALVACSSTPSPPATATVCGGLPEQFTTVPQTLGNQLTVVGGVAAVLGTFDPSLVYAEGAPSGALAYSAVTGPGAIATAMAVSSDNGQTWTGAGAVNASTPLSVSVPTTSTRCPGGTCTGTLVHEVPSLLDDAADPDASRRFKVFAHSYLVLAAGTVEYDLGYLGLFTAPAPDGPWADEGKALGWLGESSFSSEGAHTLASSFPQLSDCIAFTEPGALVTDAGTLQLAVGCAYASGGVGHLRIELLASTDHARSLSYVSRLVDDADAVTFGSDVNAADLFVAGGRTYLSVTPSGPTAQGFVGYRGCAILELTPAGDAVERTDAGVPVVCRRLDGPDETFAGACTYAGGATALGYLLPELSLDGGLPYRIFVSGTQGP